MVRFNYIHMFKNASTTSHVRIHLLGLSLLVTNFIQHQAEINNPVFAHKNQAKPLHLTADVYVFKMSE